MTRSTARPRRIPALLAAMALTVSVVSGCSVVHSAGTWNDPRNPVAGAAAGGPTDGASAAVPAMPGAGTATSAAPAFDVKPLLDPSRKYLGLEIPNSPDSITPAKDFTSWVGMKPNILGQYVSWVRPSTPPRPATPGPTAPWTSSSGNRSAPR